MFSDFLFQHRYDIDTLLSHWCAAPLPAGRVYALNSETGEITEEAAQIEHTKTCHPFTPLPFTTCQQELLTLLATEPLPAEAKTEAQTLLNTCTTMPELAAVFDTSPAAGWVRHAIKTMVLDWLDDRNMIPPSMRHVRLKPKAEPTTLPPHKTHISIQ